MITSTIQGKIWYSIILISLHAWYVVYVYVTKTIAQNVEAQSEAALK